MTTEQYVLPAEDSILAQTHHKRQEIVNELIGKGVPEDREDLKIAIGVLKDMDQSALTRKRIKVDEKTNATQEQAAGVISKLLLQAAAGGNRPFQVETPVARSAPVLGDDIPRPVLVDGETATIGTQDSYEAFVGRTTVPDEA